MVSLRLSDGVPSKNGIHRPCVCCSGINLIEEPSVPISHTSYSFSRNLTSGATSDADPSCREVGRELVEDPRTTADIGEMPCAAEYF